MQRHCLPFLGLILAFSACDKGDADTNVKDASVAASKAKPDQPADKPVVANADTGGEAAEPDAEAKARAEARKKEMTEAYAELEAWKASESERWTDEVVEATKKLVATDYKDLKSALKDVLASPHRLPENVERDKYRHPDEALAFFGVEPAMTVVEVGPGQGWYTEILAPVLAKSGKLVITDYDPNGPEDQGRTLYGRRMQAFIQRSDELYGKIERIVQTEPKQIELGADASADMVLVIRGLHGWVNRDQVEAAAKEVASVLKPGGVLGVVQHRAADDADPKESAKKGYVPQPWVIAQFEAAGLTLEDKSELNANPKDTKDYEEGVWTLPPTFAMKDADKDKYAEIGESDRMTLRFRKK